MWKIFNVPMSFEALLCEDRAYALMLQEQNENTEARPYISNTLEGKENRMTGAYSSGQVWSLTGEEIWVEGKLSCI